MVGNFLGRSAGPIRDVSVQPTPPARSDPRLPIFVRHIIAASGEFTEGRHSGFEIIGGVQKLTGVAACLILTKRAEFGGSPVAFFLGPSRRNSLRLCMIMFSNGSDFACTKINRPAINQSHLSWNLNAIKGALLRSISVKIYLPHDMMVLESVVKERSATSCRVTGLQKWARSNGLKATILKTFLWKETKAMSN